MKGALYMIGSKQFGNMAVSDWRWTSQCRIATVIFSCVQLIVSTQTSWLCSTVNIKRNLPFKSSFAT